MTGRWEPAALARLHRRTLLTLVATQGLGGVGITIGIAVASILAEQLSGSAQLAGLASTMQVVGAALAAYLLAHVMGSRGRRPGLVLGYLLGAVGAGLCVVAGVAGSFPVLLVGSGLLGATTAANGLSRYAATDLAPAHRRGRSLALVLWATTVGAVAAPNLTGVAGDVAGGLGLPRLTGPFLFGLVGVLAAAAVVAVAMRPDPLLVARQAAAAEAGEPPVRLAPAPAWQRVAAVLRSRPGVRAGVGALALGHAVMVAVMVMTPLHMHHGGAALDVIGLVISVHVLGMFVLSPVVGWAADRAGRPAVLAAGAAVLAGALALAGTSPSGASWRIGTGLFLLGLGWSCVTVAASTLLSEHAPLEVRSDVQGAADLVMGLFAAAAGALAGVVVGAWGYGALNGLAGVLVAAVAVAAWSARRAGPAEVARQPVAAGPRR